MASILGLHAHACPVQRSSAAYTEAAHSDDEMNRPRPTPSCCLCFCTTSTDHRKRKKLGNEACAEAREVLVALSGSEPLHHMLQDSSAVLCSGCHRNLGTIARLEKQLADLKSKVMLCVSALSRGAQSHSAAASTIPSRQKRPPVYTLHPQAKHTRIETDSGSPTFLNIPCPTAPGHNNHTERGCSTSDKSVPEQRQLAVEHTSTQQLEAASETRESLLMTSSSSQQPESTTLQASPDVKVECTNMLLAYTLA